MVRFWLCFPDQIFGLVSAHKTADRRGGCAGSKLSIGTLIFTFEIQFPNADLTARPCAPRATCDSACTKNPHEEPQVRFAEIAELFEAWFSVP